MDMEDNTGEPENAAEQSLRALLKEAADFKYAIEESSIVAIADADGAIRYSNHNFRKISHFDADELQGRTGRIVQEEFYTADFVRSIWSSVADGNIWRGELKFRAKDGSIYWADTSIVPFLKEDVAYQYVVIKKDITTRKLVEEQLRMAHETLRLHMDNTPLGFIEWDTQLNVKSISSRAEEIFGWSKDDLAENGTTAYAKLFEEVLPWISKLAEQLLSGEASGNKMLHRNMTKDGRTICCEWFNSVVKDSEGRIVTIVSLVLDLTDKMETEAQLLTSEAFNRGVLNSLSSNVAVVDADGDIIAVNASWEQFAVTNAEIPLKPMGVGSNYFNVCAKAAKHGDTLAAQALRGMKDILKGTETDMYLEYPCHSPTEKRWFGMKAMRFETEEPLLVVSHHDITVRKLAEEDLLHTRQLLTEAQHMAKMGNWSFDPVANDIYWSEGMFAIHGLKATDEMTPQLTVELVHYEDRIGLMQSIAQGRVSGEVLTLVYRIVRPDNGEVRVMQSISDSEADAEGNMLRLFGFTEDVTDLKEAERMRAAHNEEREMRAAELLVANSELAYQVQEKEARALELLAINLELKQAQFDRDNALLILEERVALRTVELAEKNKDVIDSINYAKRIQSSLLSPLSQLTELFEQSFILHQPRDIVSGDFYWCFEKGSRKYIVVADCTGHGVPGALMSIVGNNLLNEIIINNNIQHTSDILEQLDIRLKQKMRGDHGEVKDGMDMALCVVDTAFNELYFAGALRPLFITDAYGHIKEIAAARHCIGGAVLEAQKHFESHRMPFEPGQRIYLTSDGYYSQFGGPDNKKFMKSKFKASLAAIQPLNMKEQCLQLTEILQEWQGKHEQVDDVLVVGIEL